MHLSKWMDILSNECLKIKINAINIPEYDKTTCMFHVFLINTFLQSHFRAYFIAKIWGTIHLLYFVNSVLSHT